LEERLETTLAFICFAIACMDARTAFPEGVAAAVFGETLDLVFAAM
jgi:hypothetical protein